MTNISERSPLMRAKLSEPEKENWRFWWKLSLENFIVVFSLTSGLFLINTLPFIFSKTRLVRELEKKFSGRHVVIVAQVCNVWLFLLHFIVWGFFFCIPLVFNIFMTIELSDNIHSAFGKWLLIIGQFSQLDLFES